MARADFYLIEKPRFREQPLLLVCELATKALAAAQPLLILARDQNQAEQIDDLLWSFDAEAFIPHQLAGGEDDADIEVLIATPDMTPLSRPLQLNLRDQAVAGAFERVLEVVPADKNARDGSRQRWREYRERGIEVASHPL